MEKLLMYLLALTGTTFSFLIGAWHISLTILLIFMVIDNLKVLVYRLLKKAIM